MADRPMRKVEAHFFPGVEIMSFKVWIIAGISVLTVTACTSTGPVVTRSQTHLDSLEKHGRISAGACDDVGQMIPGALGSGGSGMMEASAAPSRP